MREPSFSLTAFRKWIESQSDQPIVLIGEGGLTPREPGLIRQTAKKNN